MGKKSVIGRGDMLFIADHGGEMWASNRYWLTRASTLSSLLDQDQIADPGSYTFFSRSKIAMREPLPEHFTVFDRLLDPARYTLPLTLVGNDDELTVYKMRSGQQIHLQTRYLVFFTDGRPFRLTATRRVKGVGRQVAVNRDGRIVAVVAPAVVFNDPEPEPYEPERAAP